VVWHPERVAQGVALRVVHSLGCSSVSRAQRTPGSAPQRPRTRAQVESCGRELSALSTYHQRCRICEVHLKLTSFEHRGKPQRFCQQCGRCHEVCVLRGYPPLLPQPACQAQRPVRNVSCKTLLRVQSLADACMLVGGKPSAQLAAWSEPSELSCHRLHMHRLLHMFT